MDANDLYESYLTPGGKRSWEAANQCWEFNDDSPMQTFAGPSKKTCISTPTSFQDVVAEETANLEEAAVLPSSHMSATEDAMSMRPLVSSTWASSNTQLVPLTDGIGCSDQQLSNSIYQAQYSSSEMLETGQPWAQHSNYEWQPFNSIGDTAFDWAVPDLAPLQAPIDQIEWTYRQPSGREQQGPPLAITEITILNPDNYSNNVDDQMAINFNGIIDSWNERRTACNGETQDSTPSATSPSVYQDTIAEETPVTAVTSSDKILYDSCFGVFFLEHFQLQDSFFKGNTPKHVALEVTGSVGIIKDADSNEYGGLLDQSAARALACLVRDYYVELSASIKSAKKIEVVVYGQLQQSEAIGNMLLEQDCFLQQPDSYDASRPYCNPQSFSHSDKEAEPFRASEILPLPQPAALPESEKAKVNDLLDSATGPTAFRAVPVSDFLTTKLKPHQSKALSMMMEKESGNIRDAEFPSVWVEDSNTEFSHLKLYNTVTQNWVARTPRLCLGGLLADEMGLGKTLTTLALIATSLGDNNKHIGAVPVTLIVCPMSTITCWQDQIERHFKTNSLTYRTYYGSTRDDNTTVLKNADVVLTTYETLSAGLRSDRAARGMKGTRKIGLLHNIDWHRVVLDEAHIVRNRASKRFQAVNALKAKHRWCLTGTPIQNRLEDLGALVEFLRVDPFDSPYTFRNTFLTPIDNGQRSGWDRLRSLIKSITLRRTKEALNADLNIPPRRDVIHPVDLNDEEHTLYDLVKRRFALAIDSGGSVMNTFQLILRLRQICNHGSDLLPQSLRAWLNEASLFGDTNLSQLQRCEVCDTALDGEDESSYRVFPCFHQVCQVCLQDKDKDYSSNGILSICPLCNINTVEKIEDTDTKSERPSEIRSTDYRPSSKVKALLQNLQKDREDAITSGQRPAKSVIFSAWTGMLDIIGIALSMNAFIYQRLDGSRSLAQRRHAIQEFRANPGCTIMLASLGSAAVGLDLTMATRVHLMEPGWNPLLEQQAMDRVHRLGQKCEVVATRYVVSGSDSIEEYIRQRQEWKMNLVASSLDDPKDRRNEAEAIIKGLRRIIRLE
ncbi:SNF2 family N-terminal domain-containing protein [Hypoxylon crocopeplum]|nr:SNF2 family N-terminal domain-containing protein [Hypoxylon crocopeplum]